MSDETIDEGANAEQQLLARSLGALIGLRRFDSPIHQARAIHGATLALSPYADGMAPSDAQRLKELRNTSIRVALSDDPRAIPEADRDWLIAAMRRILGKARVVRTARPGWRSSQRPGRVATDMGTARSGTAPSGRISPIAGQPASPSQGSLS